MSRSYLQSTVLSIEVQVSRLSMAVLDIDSGLSLVYSDHILFDRDVQQPPKSSTHTFSVASLIMAFDTLLDRASESHSFSTVKSVTVTGEPDILVRLSPDASTALAALSSSLPLSNQVQSPDFFTGTLVLDRDEVLSEHTRDVVSAAGLVTSFFTGYIQHLTPSELRRLNSDVDSTSKTDEARYASPWIVDRYQFSSHCLVTAPLVSSAAAYRSFLPEPWDVGIGFGAQADEVLISPTEVIRFPGYDQARREMCSQIGYSRWSTASRLARATPPGGTIGLDDKLFCVPNPVSKDQCRIERYRYGSAVPDFEDARAESRCLLEGQVLSFRSALERAGHFTCLATRIFCWGRAVENRALAATVCEVLGADLVASQADFEAGRLDDQYSLLPQHHPHLRQKMAAQPDIDAVDTRTRRASIGAAYWAFFALMQQQCPLSLDFNATVRAGLDPDRRSSTRGSRSSSSSSYHTTTSTEQTSLTDDRHYSPSSCDTSPTTWLASREKVSPIRPPLRTTLAMQQRMDEHSRGLVRVACADHDMFAFYGALLPEFTRLWQHCSRAHM